MPRRAAEQVFLHEEGITLDKLRGGGMQILPPSAALKADMKKVGETMLKEWLDKAGPEGKQLVDAFNK